MALLEEAAAHADLGLPVPRGTRFRTPKRLLARLLWLTNNRQVAFNHRVLDLIERLQAQTPVEVIDQIFAGQLALVRTELANLAVAQAETDTDQVATDARVNASAERIDRLTQTLSTLDRQLGDVRAALEEVVQRERLSASLRRASRDGTPGVTVTPELAAQDADPELLAVLHDAFRGTPEEIQATLQMYLPVLEACRGRRVLDVGSGRGELLELLRDSGIEAYGVEQNPVFVERCRAQGLEVLEADALEHLMKLPDRSLAAVTALRTIEHLPFAAIVSLLDHSLRVLEPGGVLIVETPNPSNLVVGTAGFYLDPTHRNLIHPELLRVLLVARGYVDVGLRYLRPVDSPLQPPASGRNPTAALVRCLNEQLYSPRDVSAVARRPGE